MLRYQPINLLVTFLVIVLTVKRDSFLRKQGQYKKSCTDGPMVNYMNLDSMSIVSLSEMMVEDASIDGISDVDLSETVVENASIDGISDVDDEDSCFGLCLAKNETYDGPVDHSFVSLQGRSVVVDYGSEDLVDTEDEERDNFMDVVESESEDDSEDNVDDDANSSDDSVDRTAPRLPYTKVVSTRFYVPRYSSQCVAGTAFNCQCAQSAVTF